MKTYMSNPLDRPKEVKASMTPQEAGDLMVALEATVKALGQLDPKLELVDAKARNSLSDLFAALVETGGPRYEYPIGPPAVLDHTEPEPSGREAALPPLPPAGASRGYLSGVGAEILPQNREWTVRVYKCDFNGRRETNETLARVFPTEAKARTFYTSTQNIQNMKVRSGDAPAFDVVLGIQDSRKHAKKRSYRELEHSLCKGDPT